MKIFHVCTVTCTIRVYLLSCRENREIEQCSIPNESSPDDQVSMTNAVMRAKARHTCFDMI